MPATRKLGPHISLVLHVVHQVFAITITIFYQTLHVSDEDRMKIFIPFEARLPNISYRRGSSSRLLLSKSHLMPQEMENQLKKCSNLSMGLWMVCSNHIKSLKLK